MRSSRGFTLMEIMVVLVLIGILTSLAVLSAGGGPVERLAEEARRLAALIELHQQEAILSGHWRGLLCASDGYSFVSGDGQGGWQTVDSDTALSQHSLPADLALNLWVDDRPVELGADGPPQVLLLASGELTAFVAVLRLRDNTDPNAPRYRVAGDTLGRLSLRELSP